MFKVIECEQRSPEWFQARLGKWTASFFDSLITQTGKPSASAKEVNNRLVAELIVGRPDETFQSEAMLRGAELEDEALEFLNFTHGFNFTKAGFLDSEKGFGCSVDGIDFEQQVGLEMKIPSLHTHIEYISNGELPAKYKAQVQGGMLVTGFKKWVFLSYHPEVRPLVVTVERDDAYIAEMQKLLELNCKAVQDKLKAVSEYIKGNE